MCNAKTCTKCGRPVPEGTGITRLVWRREGDVRPGDVVVKVLKGIEGYDDPDQYRVEETTCGLCLVEKWREPKAWKVRYGRPEVVMFFDTEDEARAHLKGLGYSCLIGSDVTPRRVESQRELEQQHYEYGFWSKDEECSDCGARMLGRVHSYPPYCDSTYEEWSCPICGNGWGSSVYEVCKCSELETGKRTHTTSATSADENAKNRPSQGKAPIQTVKSSTIASILPKEFPSRSTDSYCSR